MTAQSQRIAWNTHAPTGAYTGFFKGGFQRGRCQSNIYRALRTRVRKRCAPVPDRSGEFPETPETPLRTPLTHTYRTPPAKIWGTLAGITSKNDSTGSMHIHRLKHILKCAVTSARRAFFSSTWDRRYSFSFAEPDPHARHWVESEKPLNFLLEFVMYLPVAYPGGGSGCSSTPISLLLNTASGQRNSVHYTVTAPGNTPPSPRAVRVDKSASR